MEKISLENVLSGLLFLGFDKVDSLLLGYTTEELLKSNLYHFVMEDDSSAKLYNHLDYVDGVYQFKEDEDLDSIIKLKNLSMPMKTFLALNSNKKLIECLKLLDFKDVIIKKISSIGINNIDEVNHLFSDKEKDIMNTYGIKVNKQKRKILDK